MDLQLNLHHDDIQVGKRFIFINFIIGHSDVERQCASAVQHLYLTKEASAARVCVNGTLQENFVFTGHFDRPHCSITAMLTCLQCHLKI